MPDKSQSSPSSGAAFQIQNTTTMKAKYIADKSGTITEEKWCHEEGQLISKIIGQTADFSADELASMGISQQRTAHEFPVTLSYKYTRKGNTQTGQEVEMALVTTRENATGSIIGMHVEVLVDGMLYAHCETVGEAGAAWKSAVNEERLIMGSLF